MNMSDEVIERLARLEEGQHRQDAKLDCIDGRLVKVEQVLTFGKGAAWMLFKFGAVSAFAAGIAIALWEKARAAIQ